MVGKGPSLLQEQAVAKAPVIRIGMEGGQEFGGESRFPFGGVNTEAVNDVNGFLVKETGICVAYGGNGLVSFLDEQDDLVGGIQDGFQSHGILAKELFYKLGQRNRMDWIRPLSLNASGVNGQGPN